MVRYTTPTITLIVETIIPTADIKVTFRQGNKVLTKTDPVVSADDEETTLTVSLSQEESSMFESRKQVFVQVNWITSSGERFATQIATVPTIENLLSEVIEYGD